MKVFMVAREKGFTFSPGMPFGKGFVLGEIRAVCKNSHSVLLFLDLNEKAEKLYSERKLNLSEIFA